MTKAHERLHEPGDTKLRGLLGAGDPRGGVQMTRHAGDTVRSVYDITGCDLAAVYVDPLAHDLCDDSIPEEVRSPRQPISRWRDQIVAWHHARVSNGPTETVTKLVKRIKRVSVRDHQLPQLPDPTVALRRQAQPGPTRHPTPR